MWSKPGSVTSVSGSLPWTGKAVSAEWKAEFAGEANLAGQIPVAGNAEQVTGTAVRYPVLYGNPEDGFYGSCRYRLFVQEYRKCGQ